MAGPRPPGRPFSTGRSSLAPLGDSFSRCPTQLGTPFWSTRASGVRGFSGGLSVFSRGHTDLCSHPTASPARKDPSPAGNLLSCPGPLSGLSLQCLLWAAGPQVLAPICLVCLLPSRSPNAACPSRGARCLPAACPPACSMSKLSACRLLRSPHRLAHSPPPHPTSPWRGCATWIPSPRGHRPSLGACTHPLAPALQGKLGGSEMSLLARGWPSLTLEQNVGQGSWKCGALAQCLPGVVCLILIGQPGSVLPTGPEPRLILAGIPSSHGPECGHCGPGSASWAEVGRKGIYQEGCLAEGCHQSLGRDPYQHRLGDSPSASEDHLSLPAYSIFFQVRGVGEGTLRVVREMLAPPAQWGGGWGVCAGLPGGREGETRVPRPQSARW